MPNSFAAAIKGQNVLPNFRKILRDERMNEKEKEHQQDRRQKDLMVFGASESKEVTDEKFINVGVNAEVNFITRIGNQTKKSRPIKVVLGTAHERWLVMHSLKNLKDILLVFNYVQLKLEFLFFFTNNLSRSFYNPLKKESVETFDFSGIVKLH